MSTNLGLIVDLCLDCGSEVLTWFLAFFVNFGKWFWTKMYSEKIKNKTPKKPKKHLQQ